MTRQFIHTMSTSEGEILRKAIEKAGYTQASFAVQLGISRQSLVVMLQSAQVKEKYKTKACQILGIDTTIFDTNVLSEPQEEYVSVGAERIKELKYTIELQAQLIEQLKKRLEEYDRVQAKAG
jgi:transcriptional regulator with XRE-family HTH domain